MPLRADLKAEITELADLIGFGNLLYSLRAVDKMEREFQVTAFIVSSMDFEERNDWRSEALERIDICLSLRINSYPNFFGTFSSRSKDRLRQTQLEAFAYYFF